MKNYSHQINYSYILSLRSRSRWVLKFKLVFWISTGFPVQIELFESIWVSKHMIRRTLCIFIITNIYIFKTKPKRQQWQTHVGFDTLITVKSYWSFVQRKERERGVDSTLLNGTRARAVLYKGMRQPQITGFSDCFCGSEKGTQNQPFPSATR